MNAKHSQGGEILRKILFIFLVGISFLAYSSEIFAQKKTTGKKKKPVKTQPKEVVNPVVDGTWKEFVSAEGKFKVLFPTPPVTNTSDDGAGELRLKTVSYQAYGGTNVYAVSFTDSFFKGHFNDEKTLETLRKLIAIKGKVIRETKIKLGEVVGLEIIYEKANKTISQHRVYAVGKRSYELIAGIKLCPAKILRLRLRKIKLTSASFLNPFN